MKKSIRIPRNKGFTLLEVLIIAVVVAVLAGISAPFGLRLLERYRVTVARDKVYSAMRQTQNKSQQESRVLEFALRQRDGQIEWANFPKDKLAGANWQRVGKRSLEIDEETNLAESDDLYYIRFDEKGNVEYRLGRVTFASGYFPDIKRCVIVSTLIGEMRTSKEQVAPHDGHLCY